VREARMLHVAGSQDMTARAFDVPERMAEAGEALDLGEGAPVYSAPETVEGEDFVGLFWIDPDLHVIRWEAE
jgi:hypothetical protein